jgi:hypothetical protein
MNQPVFFTPCLCWTDLLVAAFKRSQENETCHENGKNFLFKKEFSYPKLAGFFAWLQWLNNRVIFGVVLTSEGKVLSLKTGNEKYTWADARRTGNATDERVRVWCKLDKKRKNKRVSRLMAEAFYRPLRKGEVVDHADNNPANNAIWNLSIMKHKTNIRRQERCRK